MCFRVLKRVFLMQGLPWLGLMVLLLGSIILYLPLFRYQVVGFMHDDGVYTMTATMLAEGKGLGLPNLHELPAQVKYPIVYPFILALGWILNPSFPENLGLLHGLTTGFAWLSLPLLFMYCRHVHRLNGWGALLITLLVAVNFQFVFYTTALMSEAPYFFFSLLTLWVAEAQVFCSGKSTDSRQRKAWVWVLILLSIVSFHTRTVAVALIGSIEAQFLLQKRLKEALIYGLGILLLGLLPWFWWVKVHTPQLTALNYPLAVAYAGYGQELFIHASGQASTYLHLFLQEGLQPLMQGSLQTLLPGLDYWLNTQLHLPIISLLCQYTLALLLLVPALSAFRQKQFSTSALYLAFYGLMLCFWMYANQAARFLVVVQPWLWLGLYRGLADCFGTFHLQKNGLIKKSVLGLFGFGLVIFTLWPAWQGYNFLRLMRTQNWLEPSGQHAMLWQEYQALFHHVEQKTPFTATVAGLWDPAIYLYCGRYSFPLSPASLQPVEGQINAQSVAQLFRSMQRFQVNYIIQEPFLQNQQLVSFNNPVVERLLLQYPGAFQVVYQSPHGYLKLLKVNYPSSRR